MSNQRDYTKPTVTVYGAVEEITQQGNAPSTDVPQGDSNTAYSPG